MPVTKLTDKPNASAIDEGSSVIVSIKEDSIEGVVKEAIRKAPLVVLTEAIKHLLLNRKQKGCYYSHIDLKNKKIYLDTAQSEPVISTDGFFYIFPVVDSFFESKFEIGQTFSIVNGVTYDNVGVITAVDGNEITYEGDLGFDEAVVPEELTVKDYMFFVPAVPEAGLVEFDVTGGEFGTGTIAGGESSIAIGRFNKLVDAILMIGNGTSDDDRRNAFVLDWEGNLTVSGELTDKSGISLAELSEKVGDTKVALEKIIELQESFIKYVDFTIVLGSLTLSFSVVQGTTWEEFIASKTDERIQTESNGYVTGTSDLVVGEGMWVPVYLTESENGLCDFEIISEWGILSTDKIKPVTYYTSTMPV